MNWTVISEEDGNMMGDSEVLMSDKVVQELMGEQERILSSP